MFLAAVRAPAAPDVQQVGLAAQVGIADALAWLERFGNPYWIVVADREGKTAIDWGIYGAPETFLVDGKGVVRWKYVGPLTDEVIAAQLLPKLDEIGHGR
jgi:cytochrome c biogenesis protein CcmG/thiol:disulfide interchange protein DsbE